MYLVKATEWRMCLSFFCGFEVICFYKSTGFVYITHAQIVHWFCSPILFSLCFFGTVCCHRAFIITSFTFITSAWQTPKTTDQLHFIAFKRETNKDNEMHLVEREGRGCHSDQDVEEVRHQLRLRVQGQREKRRGCTSADHPNLPLPQTIELVKGLPASLC